MDETTVTPVTPTTPADAGVRTEVAAPSHGDWNATAKNLRETRAELAELKNDLKSLIKAVGSGQTPPKPETSPKTEVKGDDSGLKTQMAELLAVNAFNDALHDLDLPLTREQRNALRRLYKAETPSDVGAWMLPTVTEVLGVKRAVTPAAVSAPVKPVDAGPPVGSGSAEVPLDPAAIPQSVVDAWTPEQAQAWYAKFKSKAGGFVHPFAKAREEERATGDVSAASRQIAEVLARVAKR